jgi:hypothetical protein
VCVLRHAPISENDFTASLPNYDEFAKNDLKVLEDCPWERVAYHVWFDTVKTNEPKHSQKWTGMITARLLKSIADDSRAVVRLTRVLVVLTLVLICLTMVLCGDIFVRFLRH